MNNYYYGKSGKGDFRKEDMPETRMQLFWDTLRTRLSALCRLNLMYMVVFLPMMIVLLIGAYNTLNQVNLIYVAQQGNLQEYVNTVNQQQNGENAAQVTVSEEVQAEIAATDVTQVINGQLMSTLLWLIPCIAITGPFTAGVSYVTRNWARDEHAFIWSDFKDALKANWKQSLVVSVITSILPAAIYVGWRYYGQMAGNSVIMIVPQVLVVLVGIIWAISVTYMHPMIVTYELKQMDVFRNSLLLGVARLPFSVGIRLLHCVPAIIWFVAIWFFGLDPMIGLLILGAYYVIIGFGLSRFVTASYTNAVFDRFINARIEGAKVNQGLREEDDDEDEEEDEGHPETAD
jgi:uncharacterized membrane protein YesL